MKICGRRQILFLPKRFLSFKFIVSLLLILLFIVQHDFRKNYFYVKYFQKADGNNLVRQKIKDSGAFLYPQAKNKTGVEHNEQMLSSACLPRSALNNSQVKLYSNRKSDKQYYLTIDIPTIKRKTGSEYLMKTLNSLVSNDNEINNQYDILIVILVGDSDKNIRKDLSKKINEHYHKFIESGNIDIIQVLPEYYPSRAKLKRHFGDAEVRIKWRSKQVVDFSFLFCYCYGLSKYHVQLEDDVVASPHYFLKLKDFIEEHERKESWFTLDASVLGYIGKVYHNNDLKEIATFYYLFFDEMPVDWLEYIWRDVKGQSGRWRFRVASLFQHIGLVSSLLGTENLAKEPYFDIHSKKFLGQNPPAKLYTNISSKSLDKIESAYEKGSRFFWGECNGERCFVKIIFQDTVRVKRIDVETGGNFAVNDIINIGNLELGTVVHGGDCLQYNSATPMNFNHGRSDISFPEGLLVNCFKIIVEKQKQWIFLREINVWQI